MERPLSSPKIQIIFVFSSFLVQLPKIWSKQPLLCRWHKALNPKGLRLKHNKFNQLSWMRTIFSKYHLLLWHNRD
ncbi:MAG: hypothetical protein DRP65_04675 [Planctomycetota bacterium]|nr:MAG: hypothetical protein DRP65_04675 [Planctomycetota bacterium]